LGVAADRLDALAAQAEHLAGLGFGRNLDDGLAIERGHDQLGAQRGLAEADRHLAEEVVALALEDVVLAHPHFDVEVARRRAGGAGLALARQADAVAVVDAGRNLHLQHFFRLDAAGAVAGLARVADGLAVAGAVRAGLLDAEDALLHAHATVAAAGAAGFDLAVGGAAAAADAAGHHRGDLDFLLDAGDGFFQVEVDDVAQIG